MAANAFSTFHPRIEDMVQRLGWKTASVLFAGLGLAGVDWVSDTTVHAGDWWVFHAVTDCVLTGINYSPGKSSGSPSGVTIKAGDRIYGPITSIQLTSGTGELYRASVTPA